MLHRRHVINCRKLQNYLSCGLPTVSYFFFFADAKLTHNFPEANKWTPQRMSTEHSSCTSSKGRRKQDEAKERKKGLKGTVGQNDARGLMGLWKRLWMNHQGRSDTTFICADSIYWPVKQPKNSLKIIKMYLNDRGQKIIHFPEKL